MQPHVRMSGQKIKKKIKGILHSPWKCQMDKKWAEIRVLLMVPSVSSTAVQTDSEQSSKFESLRRKRESTGESKRNTPVSVLRPTVPTLLFLETAPENVLWGCWITVSQAGRPQELVSEMGGTWASSVCCREQIPAGLVAPGRHCGQSLLGSRTLSLPVHAFMAASDLWAWWRDLGKGLAVGWQQPWWGAAAQTPTSCQSPKFCRSRPQLMLGLHRNGEWDALHPLQPANPIPKHSQRSPHVHKSSEPYPDSHQPELQPDLHITPKYLSAIRKTHVQIPSLLAGTQMCVCILWKPNYFTSGYSRTDVLQISRSGFSTLAKYLHSSAAPTLSWVCNHLTMQ